MYHTLKTFQIALRNLTRNKRRTTSTLFIILTGLVGLIVLDGYISYSLWGFKETVINTGTGHVQVARSPAYFDEGDVDPYPYLFQDSTAVLKELRRRVEVKDVVPGINFTAVLEQGGIRESIVVKAVPASKFKTSFSFLGMESGEASSPGGSGFFLVGRGLSHKLDVREGKGITLYAVGSGGGLAISPLTVTGVVSTGVAIADAKTAYMDLDTAMNILGITSVPLLTVYLESTEETESFRNSLLTKPWKSTPEKLSVKTYEELSPAYLQASNTYTMVLRVAEGIVLMVVLFSVLGSISLSVMERRREIGTLRSFGLTGTRVIRLILAEGLVLTLLGCGLGTLAGLACTTGVNSLGGILLPPQPGFTDPITIFLRPSEQAWWKSSLWIVASGLLASLLPAVFTLGEEPAALLKSV